MSISSIETVAAGVLAARFIVVISYLCVLHPINPYCQIACLRQFQQKNRRKIVVHIICWACHTDTSCNLLCIQLLSLLLKLFATALHETARRFLLLHYMMYEELLQH
jgi:hypothetical protein